MPAQKAGLLALLLLVLQAASAGANQPVPPRKEASRAATAFPCRAEQMFRALREKANAIPTRSAWMISERYVHLHEAAAGLAMTGVPLVAFDGQTFDVAGRDDDPGMYFLVPEVMRLTGWTAEKSVAFTFRFLLGGASVAGGLGLLLVVRSWPGRLCALLGILCVAFAAGKLGDLYMLGAVASVGIVPWFLYFVEGRNRGFVLALFSLVAGLCLGLMHLIRSHSGTPVALLILVCVTLLPTWSRKRKLAVLGALAAGFLLVLTYEHSLLSQRDDFLRAHRPEATTTQSGHPLWLSAYIGFGFLSNEYVPAFRDEIAVEKVCSASADAPFVSKKYELELRRAVFQLVREHPALVCSTVAAKLGIILFFTLVSVNLGLPAAVFYPKGRALETAFWCGIAFSALPGMLAVPALPYLQGLIALAVIYGIVSLDHAVEQGCLQRIWRRSFRQTVAHAGQTMEPPRVFLHVWSGAEADAMRTAQARYPGCRIAPLSHRELRAAGWRGQLRCLRQLRGCAVVFYFQELAGQPQIQLLPWSGLIHRCGETVLADSAGRFEIYRRRHLLNLLPKTVLSALIDSFVFVASFLALALLRTLLRPVPPALNGAQADLDVAYLFPYPLSRTTVGGASSHVRGLLGGLRANSALCEIFSGCTLAQSEYPIQVIASKRHRFLFWESAMLSYNLRFALAVRRRLGNRRVRALYQRHGRFVVAGALLARWLRVPCVLEYNGSEEWIARHWDPSRFMPWLKLCEKASLWAASLIVVVSEPLREELLQQGVPSERILVNPNAVDPAVFHPGCGGQKIREQFGWEPEHILVGFLGTFAYWHGVEVLAEAIRQILEKRASRDEMLRFLLVGDGLLRPDIMKALQPYEDSGRVVFTGSIPHDGIPAHLDACDILVSPHVPMPDGRPFFGSPTKLFEYMALGKAIVASGLDQLAQVLEHETTACLVEPGNVEQLAHAVRRLAADPQFRERLGHNARKAAIERHTWRQNASRLLGSISRMTTAGAEATSTSKGATVMAAQTAATKEPLLHGARVGQGEPHAGA